MVLETARLRLSPLTADHLPHLVALHGDAQVMAFITGAGEPPEVVANASLPDLLSRRTWAIFEKVTEAFLGWVSLRLEGDQAELGYRLVRSAWGQGFASEAAGAVVDMGFGTEEITRIWGQTMSVNAGSRRVMETAGLAYVRTFHLDWDDPLPGSEQGEVEYAITQADWRGQQRSPNKNGGPEGPPFPTP